MNAAKRTRVLLAKPGLDGHDLGIKAVARALRDDGMEVIYLGLNVSPETAVGAAIQESVDVLGISCLSGSHMLMTEKILGVMSAQKVEDVKLVVGGIIPDEDVSVLEGMGVAAIFNTGTPMPDIVAAINGLAA
ncbi:MAG: cobalamin-dependent protein [Alphaproteobacteria bacterium]|jgi:methylmalonyl-CoA mutase C-terminal domain/subunit|nr:methylmalonyl-CoA mutase [Rhodospirillaceae bacterium]MDP6406564.1 cobalamin-dependent protein [Alphaproteobacteria bacterium]MDP6623156.1 cobalamin-dependent protein [Alphaproteobacteria bacterium]|tara:strand:+ start:1480 stop:1878 length:399 start_codon:yes stop_codon:yes gene_type:complete